MRRTLFILFSIYTLALFGQRSSKVIQDDMDGDGIPEELVIHYYLGKVESAELKYDNKTKTCFFDVKPKATRPTVINTVPVCDDLLQPKYQAMTKTVDSILFETPPTRKLDPNMSWLLDSYATKKDTPKDSVIASKARFKARWKKGEYTKPDNQRLLIKGRLVKKINKLHNKADTTKKSWVFFDAEPLDKAKQIEQFNLEGSFPVLIDSVGQTGIYKTGHSVFLQNDSMHKVVFATDGVLFENIQKIEWESIQQVGEKFGYLFILTYPYPAIQNKLFIVDYKTGKTWEISKEFTGYSKKDFMYIQSFELIENELFIFLKERPSSNGIKQKRIELGPTLKYLKSH